MNETEFMTLLNKFKSGEVNSQQILDTVAQLPFMDLGCAKIDTHRQIRCGVEEVIYCPGKSDEHLKTICASINSKSGLIIFTRVTKPQSSLILKHLPTATYYAEASIIAVNINTKPTKKGIVVVTGGTSDIPVAEEAAITAELLGNSVERIYDVGVAGIHRLFPYIDKLRTANAVIAVAGMEGAIVTVVGGLIDSPLIAVPTSVGYGANLGGMTTMLSMLNCCVPGVSVVNIDNGFGAAVSAHLINRKIHKTTE